MKSVYPRLNRGINRITDGLPHRKKARMAKNDPDPWRGVVLR